MKKILVLVAIFAIFSSFSLKAETTSSWYNKFYVGAGVGFFPGKFEDKDTYITSENFIYPAHLVNNDINLFIGYDILSFLSLETGYRHFIRENYKNYISPTEIPSSTNHDGNHVYINSILKYQFNKHTPFLSFGVGILTLQKKTYYNNEKIAQTQETGINYILGLGYEYALTKNHNLGFKYTYNILPSITLERNRYIIDEYLKIKNLKNLNYSNIEVYYKYSF